MAKTLALPEEFVTRVDFDRFWEEYLRGPVTKKMLVGAKRQLLDAGVPESAVYAYLFNLSGTLAGESDGLVAILERLMECPGEMTEEELQFLEEAEDAR